MRAVVLHGPAGSGDLRIDDVEEPVPSAGEVRVKVHRTGWCGSDVHFVHDGTAQPAYTPIILGHESMGSVDEVGEGVSDLPVGTRVSVVPVITCGRCARCRGGRTVICRERRCIGSETEGSLADYVVVPRRNVLPVPEDLPDDLAAVATDSVATAYHAVATRGGLTSGERVAVWGVGGLGLSAVGIARTLGADTVMAVDPRAEARSWALETGADEALAPDEALERIRSMDGVDLALEFVGKEQAVESAVRSLDDGGRAVIVGVSHEPASAGRLMTFVLRERQMLGSYGNEPDEIAEVMRLLADGRLDLPRVVGDVVDFEDAPAALARVRDGDTGGSRILVALD